MFRSGTCRKSKKGATHLQAATQPRTTHVVSSSTKTSTTSLPPLREDSRKKGRKNSRARNLEFTIYRTVITIDRQSQYYRIRRRADLFFNTTILSLKITLRPFVDLTISVQFVLQPATFTSLRLRAPPSTFSCFNTIGIPEFALPPRTGILELSGNRRCLGEQV